MDICPSNNIFVSMVRERALQVGAIPKYLFHDYTAFKGRMDNMKLYASSSLS